MNNIDIKNLFRFFKTVNPQWQYTEDTVDAWALILEPYEYEPVKRAAVACLRRIRYIPDPAEIIAEISTHAPREDTLTPEEIAKLDRFAELKRRRVAAGLPPTLLSAGKFGYKTIELAAKYEELGLGIDNPPAPKHEATDAEIKELQAFFDTLRRSR